jgi:hypothetical protein
MNRLRARSGPIADYGAMGPRKELLDEFILRYEHVFGEPISRADAAAMFARLIALFRVLRKPAPADPQPDMTSEL